MATPYRDVEVGRFADWLAQQDSDRLWTVDGEVEISGALPLPCSGAELAGVLRDIGSRLRIFGPDGGRDLSPNGAEFDRLAATEDDALVFEIAWISDGQPGEHWMLVEDTLAERAQSAALEHSRIQN